MKTIYLLIFLITAPLFNVFSQKDSVSFVPANTEDLEAILAFSGLYVYILNIPNAKDKTEAIYISLDEYNDKGLIKKCWTENFGNVFKEITFKDETKKSFVSDNVKIFVQKKDKYEFKLHMKTAQMGYSTSLKIDSSLYKNDHELRIFAEHPYKPNTKFPVLLIGSYWNIVIDGKPTEYSRFCMEKELPVDFSSDAFQSMPHYYVLSIEYRNNNKE